MNIRSRKYIFYQERVEFYEGFLNLRQKTINYRKVTDCLLTKNIWDRLLKAGTIQFMTAGHEITSGGKAAGGIRVQYIKN